MYQQYGVNSNSPYLYILNICVFQSLGDLWGPLLICLLLSCILSLTAPGDSASLVFAAVFVIVWYVRSSNIYKENFMKSFGIYHHCYYLLIFISCLFIGSEPH